MFVQFIDAFIAFAIVVIGIIGLMVFASSRRSAKDKAPSDSRTSSMAPASDADAGAT